MIGEVILVIFLIILVFGWPLYMFFYVIYDDIKKRISDYVKQKKKKTVEEMCKEYKEELRAWADEEISKQNAEYRTECDRWLYTAIDEAKRNSIEYARQAVNKIKNDCEEEKNNYKIKCDSDVSRILHSESQNYPWLAKIIADFEYSENRRTYQILRNKKNPAIKASEEVKRIAKEKRELLYENKQLQYQLNYYESVFPWLEEFKQIPPREAYSYLNQSDEADDSERYEKYREYLSPEEYANLPKVEKFQRALDRYKEKRKNNRGVGIGYERYIGFLLETDGYRVLYNGAIKGLEDMGRDLIARKDKQVLVIQCKRWGKEKIIHEKHIFQLYATMVLLASEEKGKDFKAVFITTTTLSDVARRCAEYLDVKLVENLPYKDYPMIKCNIAKNGEKIYHLPFDQQYDRVSICGKPGAFYASTIKEAEDKGFRRAYRWVPDKS
ncbi:restriction endonuclease [Candidatus Avoscillospira sp. LCP25S3_F1]|uniref:restriction endonuclease n=1 Tax=Candidatus Avoscillospira sp. LCP25S3_F1 TaxID=3438825 RepID=UPI003F919FB0